MQLVGVVLLVVLPLLTSIVITNLFFRSKLIGLIIFNSALTIALFCSVTYWYFIKQESLHVLLIPSVIVLLQWLGSVLIEKIYHNLLSGQQKAASCSMS